MSDAFSLLFSILRDDILPIFIVAGVGFVLARHFDVSVQTLSRVTFNALVPCLIFDALVDSTLSGRDFGRMALFCVLNSAVAAYYYLRVIVYMYMRDVEGEGADYAPSLAGGMALAIAVAGIVLLGVLPAPFADLAQAAVAPLLR